MWWLWNPMMASGMTPQYKPASQTLATFGVQACCSWTPHGGFHHFSDNWLQVTGLAPSECMQQGWAQRWHENVQNEFVALVHDLFSAAPEDRLDSAILQGEMLRSEGDWGYCECLMVPVGTPDAPQLTILVTDKTHEHQLRHQTMLANQETTRAQKGRSSFLSNMSHELRTPLNAILGFAQLLDEVENLPEDSRKEYIGYIREGGEALLGKINDLIEMANIDSRRCQLDEMAFNAKESVEAAIEMHSHVAFRHDQTVHFTCDQPQLILRADRAKWMRCLSHLIGNALEHNPDAKDIYVHLLATAEQGMCVKITDRGRGIPRERLCNIRDSLHVQKSYYATGITDMGIGLAVTKELMQLHGGRLEIHSDERHGTTAVLFLPAERIVSMSAQVKNKLHPAMKVSFAEEAAAH